MTYDIAVVGLGATGAGALWAAASRGARAVGFEQYELAHDRGSSHGLSRVFRGAASEGRPYTELALRSLEIWRDLERRSGVDLVTLTSGVIIAPDGTELITDSKAVLDGGGMTYEQLAADEIRARFPQHYVRDDDVAIVDPSLGIVRPERTVIAEIDAARRCGAQVRTRSRVTAVHAVAGGVEVVVDGVERVRARKAVLAAGPWLSRLTDALPMPLVTRRAVLTWFHPRPGTEDQFAPERFPAFRRQLDEEFGWGAGIFDDHGVKIGLRDQGGYVIDDPSANRTEVEPWEVERVEAFCARQFPDLIPSARHATGCMITLTPDERFVIEELADQPGVIAVAACSGHGFKTSAAVGELGVQLALGEQSTVDPRPFSSDRLRAVAETGHGATARENARTDTNTGSRERRFTGTDS